MSVQASGATAEHPHVVRAAVLRTVGEPLSVETIRLRAVGPGEVRVRIDRAGVCHSDLSLANGLLATRALPTVLGHEACGTVVEVGDGVDGLAVGQRVIPLWIVPCGACFHCTNGEPYLCGSGSRSARPYAIDAEGGPVHPGLSIGAFAEQTVVPQNAVVPVPDDIDTVDAALLGCAVMTGVGAVVNTAQVTPGSSVLVMGLGGVGLSALLGARMVGAATVVAVDRNPEKAGPALAAGATAFVPVDGTTADAVRVLTGGRGADFAFDCVGSARTIRDAWSLTRRGGTAVVVGVGGRDDMVQFSALELFSSARTLRGCVAGSVDAAADLPTFFEWIRTGRLDLRGLVTGHGGLVEVNRALDDLTAARGVRTVLSPGD